LHHQHAEYRDNDVPEIDCVFLSMIFSWLH
jgi:hypothetical protein